MTDVELLRQVVPDAAALNGWYCVIGLGNSKDALPIQEHYKTLEEVKAQAERLVKKKRNVFFSCGLMKTDESREASNSGWMQSFFLDIDCGPDKAVPDKYGRIKGYVDQATGMRALRDLCATMKLPRPTIVNSGRGWHVYWPLTEPVAVDKWLDVANTFKARCAEHKFIVDPAVPADAARVLRIPGTFNFKEDPPLDVTVMYTAQPIKFEDFAALMGPIMPAKRSMPARELDDFTKALMGNRQSRFKTIMLKSIKGEGCEQLKRIAESQDTTEEPLWRAGLSVAQHCVDKDTAIHKISNKHPQYDHDKTAAKAEAIKGPYTCERFNELAPGVCNTCKHWEVIRSPISLGNEIAEAPPNEVIEEPKSDGTKEAFVVPTLPAGYFRGKMGGIYKHARDNEEAEGEDDEQKVVKVYDYDLFVLKRMRDPAQGETLVVRVSTPRDGPQEFPLTLVDLTSRDELRKVLSFNGIVALKTQMEQILYYIAACARMLQVSQEVEMMRSQFGWADDDQKFILGDREIGVGFVKYSPPTKVTANVAAALRPVGSLERWKEIFNIYGLPGFEPHAFAAFSAFGAPLLKFTGVKGAIINLVNNRSGTGKSTVLQVMNSVWGHPDELMIQWRDTLNVKLHRMAVMCNLPLGVDEITKMSGDDFSDMAYSVTQGAPRRRMKANVNEEREAMGFWSTIMVSTSNADMIDKLEALKSTSEGELMRLFQYKIDPTNNLTRHEAKRIFGLLQGNYGRAGPIYAQYLVSNLEEVIDFLFQVQDRFDRDAGIESKERFRSALAASNIAGGIIAKNLGIHDIDVRRIHNWAVEEVQRQHSAAFVTPHDYAGVIGEFLFAHNTNILVVNKASSAKTGIAAAPIVLPKGALLIRYEPDTKRMFIIASSLKQFCVTKQITYRDMLTTLSQSGAFIASVRTRLDSGLEFQAPPVEALEFDSDALGITPTIPLEGDAD